MTVKENMLKIIRDLPEETTIEEAIEKLYLLYKVNKGIVQAENGRTVSNEEAKKRIDNCLFSLNP